MAGVCGIYFAPNNGYSYFSRRLVLRYVYYVYIRCITHNHFQNICCLQIPDPCKLAHSIVASIAETKVQKSKFLLRLIPVEVTCKVKQFTIGSFLMGDAFMISSSNIVTFVSCAPKEQHVI